MVVTSCVTILGFCIRMIIYTYSCNPGTVVEWIRAAAVSADRVEGPLARQAGEHAAEGQGEVPFRPMNPLHQTLVEGRADRQLHPMEKKYSSKGLVAGVCRWGGGGCSG